jgi:sialate O-acetylesterase
MSSTCHFQGRDSTESGFAEGFLFICRPCSIEQKTSMKTFALFLLFLPAATALHAAVHVPAIFGDHMVLQQDVKVPVWGTALPGEKVTVTVGDHTATATTGLDCKWRVDLAPFPTASAPMTMTVAGSNTLTFQDVLIGEVWVASGKSNMEVPINWMPDAAQITAQAADPQLRLFYVEHGPFQAESLEPRDNLSGHWEVSSAGVVNNFSAVAYFFGRDLRTQLKRPVGLIGSYVGGTPASSWISQSGLAKAPAFDHYLDALADVKAASLHYPDDLNGAINNMNKWSDDAVASYAAALSHWKSDMINSAAGNNPQSGPPPAQPPGTAPQLPPDLAGDRHTPTLLYNGMIAPLIPYAIKGVIWYQGEDNGVVRANAIEYRTLFPRLITDWREKWGQGDFPFLFVQLAGFTRDDIGGPGGVNYALLREAQAMALSLPKTGMATAVDIGAGTDIHPKDKLDVGHRLALDARHVAYGEDLIYTGPVYDKMTVEGKTIRVTFTQTGGGLIIGSAPWTAPGLQPIPATSLVGFTIAGADKKFVAADAKIDGNTVVLSSPQIAAPVAARYDWANLTQANLYNKEGLPAFPFRSDDWDDVPSPANPFLPLHRP